ncbi:right-handed parallel beta-helix repeat-containing protein [Methylobacterium marchantiae]|uniref:Right-handed parallel beta-helix repeat-containing protein n=1 Tax=Methylobacterium marchantiae TaxID=600331 RepID=A0ABW3X2X0_9HYPH
MGQTIQAIVEQAKPGSAFCIKSGTHRLQVISPKADQRFHGEAGATLSGARRVTVFERQGPYWVAPGQRQMGVRHGTCLAGRETCVLAAGFFIDDKPLRQVASLADLTEGTFVFDHSGERIVFADDPTGHVVEASVARYAFRSAAPNVRIDNLRIEKYYSPAQEGAIQGRSAHGWRVRHSDVRLNSGAGISIGSGGSVVASRIHHNGQLGVTGAGTGLVVEANAIYANNLSGFDPGWEAGGVKIASADGVVMRGNEVYDNHGPGLWCDMECRNVTIDANIVEENDGAGIFHEISGNAVIRNNVLHRNGRVPAGWVWGADIQVAASRDVEVVGNRITVRRGGAGIMLIDQSRRTDTGGIYRTENNHIHDNTLVFEGRGRAGGASDAPAEAPNARIIETGNNRFERNRYLSLPGSPPSFTWGRRDMDFAAFQALGQDASGTLRSDITRSPETSSAPSLVTRDVESRTGPE